METYEVRAYWDDDAGVWWAESDDVPGVAAEAGPLEELHDELRVLIPELLRLNAGSVAPATAFRLVADRTEALRPAQMAETYDREPRVILTANGCRHVRTGRHDI